MKNGTKFIGSIAFIALIALIMAALSLTGCPTNDDDDNGDNNNNDEKLPPSSGVNAVSGKTWFYSYRDVERTVFSATSDNDVSGTYVRYMPANGTYKAGEKFRYIETGTGFYTWNEKNKTVTLKPEKNRIVDGGSSVSDYYGSLVIDNNYREFMDKTAYRSFLQAGFNKFNEAGEEALNMFLQQAGFSSLDEYFNFCMDFYFSNATYDYSFSTDGKALFLQRALPENNGVNELSGQTYYGLSWNYTTDKREKDMSIVYVFSASGVTMTSTIDEPYLKPFTGSYSYDSRLKKAYLRVSTIVGENMFEYFAAQTVPAKHHLIDDNAYRAAMTNEAFGRIDGVIYNSTEKTIRVWGYYK